MLNAISIDLEEWFQVTSFESIIGPKHQYKSRASIGTDILLKIFDDHKVKATFFVLGNVAKNNKSLISEIYSSGHEIASHGYNHQLITKMTKSGFDYDIKISKEIIENIINKKIVGYRAPSFSINNNNNNWVFEVLSENQFEYDSSILVGDIRFGITKTNNKPFRIGKKNIYEFPVTSPKILFRNIPYSGGFYFRFWPYRFISYCLNKINKLGIPGMVYLHPWELDINHPRLKNIGLKKNFIHYHNINSTSNKLRLLLESYSFSTVSNALDEFFQKEKDII